MTEKTPSHKPPPSSYLHPDGDFGARFHRTLPKKAESSRLGQLLIVNAVVMIAELAGGIWTGSTALVSDAGHMLTHVLALGLAYLAIVLSRRRSSEANTFGYQRAEVLAAFANGVAILFFVLWIALEAIASLLAPHPILVREMLVVATLGLAVNLFGAFLLWRLASRDMNIRGAFVHLLADTLSSVAVVAGGIAILYTGWRWIDGAVALVIAAVVLAWGIGLVRDSSRVLLESVPPGLDLEIVCRSIESVPGVLAVHDAHLWSIVPGRTLMTGHLIVEDIPVGRTAEILAGVNRILSEKFAIGHTTFQFETRR